MICLHLQANFIIIWQHGDAPWDFLGNVLEIGRVNGPPNEELLHLVFIEIIFWTRHHPPIAEEIVAVLQWSSSSWSANHTIRQGSSIETIQNYANQTFWAVSSVFSREENELDCVYLQLTAAKRTHQYRMLFVHNVCSLLPCELWGILFCFPVEKPVKLT